MLPCKVHRFQMQSPLNGCELMFDNMAMKELGELIPTDRRLQHHAFD
jgi:hypothetical protein